MSIINKAILVAALLVFATAAIADGINNSSGSGGGGGSGTVTSVSVVTANGISGSVANPTTTPAITLTLGAITPSSVAINGCTIGSNGLCVAAPTSLFQASGATGGNAQTTIAHSTLTTSDQQFTVVNDNGTDSTIIFTNGSARDNTTLVRQASTTAIANTGPGLYIGTETAAAPVVLFEGGVANGVNNALTISAPNAIAFNQFGNGALFISGGAGAISSGTLPIASGGTNCATPSITCFNNITGYSAAGATGTTSTNLVFSASPTFSGTVTLPDSGTWGSGGINGSAIGGTTRAAGAFTTLAANGTANFTGTFQVNSNTITWPAAAISVARIDAGQTFIGNQVFQASGASGSNSAMNFIANLTTTSFVSDNLINDTGAGTAVYQIRNSVGAGTTLVNVANTTLLANTGGGLYLGSESSSTNVVLFAGGTVTATNSALSISGSGQQVTIGSATPAAGQRGDLSQIKETDAAAAPGAGYAVLKWVAGSAGSCNLIAYAGTSTTPVTIASTVGSGC